MDAVGRVAATLAATVVGSLCETPAAVQPESPVPRGISAEALVWRIGKRCWQSLCDSGHNGGVESV